MLVYVFISQTSDGAYSYHRFFVKLLMAAIHGDRFILIYGFYGCNQMTSTLGYVAQITWKFVTSIDLCQSYR
jgi:hypothetical protein